MNGIKNDCILLSKDFIYWQWYQDSVVKEVFLHLLLSAKIKETKWQNEILRPGQVITNQIRLSSELGYGRTKIRGALEKLKKSSEISIYSTNKYTIITILNWGEYFCEGCCGE